MAFRAQAVVACTSLACLLAPSVARAQSCVDFSEVRPDGKLTQVFTSSALTDHVSFFFRVVAGRSYSVEVQNVARNYLAGDFSMNVNTSDCPTSNMAGLINTASAEPTPGGIPGSFARVSFTAAATTSVEFRAGATSGTVQLQATVHDTTLFSNWFFLGGDYVAFTLIRNTTNSAVTYTVNWRDSGGTIRGTVSGTLAANGSALHNARDHVNPAVTMSGTVEIVNGGTPAAIVASTTVLSGTTGLSFDAPFATRR